MYLDNNNKMVFSLSLPAFNQKIDSLKEVDEKLLVEFLRINERLDKQFETQLKNEIVYRTNFTNFYTRITSTGILTNCPR